MSFTYSRFYLDSATDDNKKAIEALFGNNSAELKIERAAYDWTKENPSISILWQSQKNIQKKQNKIKKYLEKKQINPQKIEFETLEDGETQTTFSCPHDASCPHDHHDEDDHHHSSDDHHHDNHWLKAGIGIVLGIALLVLSIASLNLPLIAYIIINGITALVTVFLGYNVYKSAFRALTQKKIEMSTLYTISTVAIIGITVASFFIPGLPMILESAPLILGLWHLGEGIEHTLLDKINKKLDIRDCAPKTVPLKSAKNRQISVKQLIPNDVIILETNDVIPVDGILTTPGWLHTTRINGAPRPTYFEAGSAVKAGMSIANNDAPLEIRVSKTYQHSYLSLIAKNIANANSRKAPIELLTNKILKYFVPTLLVVAIVAAIVVGILFTPALAIQCGIAVLVSACPCALSMITPMAIKIGMKKASEHGIIFKDGKALQAASDIDTVVFDLNGTLTKGEISVTSIFISKENKKYLEYISLLEEHSTHPVAETIKKYIKTQLNFQPHNVSLKTVDNIDKSDHSGIKGMISGEQFIIGNQDMLKKHHIKITAPYDNIENGTIYMVKGSTIIGQIALSDPLREDAKQTIQQLQSMGKEVHICTGADEVQAKKYARLLNINEKHICANTVGVTSEDDDHAQVSKETYIKSLQQKGRKVAMVGDALNDLTAIKQADIGVAVQSSIGDTVEKHADVVIQKQSLFPIATAFDIASNTKGNIFQNLFMSLTYNSVITIVAAGCLIGLGFALNPALGVALVIIESAVILANLYRLKNQEPVSLVSTQDNVNPINDAEKTTGKIINTLDTRPKLTLVSNHHHTSSTIINNHTSTFSFKRHPVLMGALIGMGITILVTAVIIATILTSGMAIPPIIAGFSMLVGTLITGGTVAGTAAAVTGAVTIGAGMAILSAAIGGIGGAITEKLSADKKIPINDQESRTPPSHRHNHAKHHHKQDSKLIPTQHSVRNISLFKNNSSMESEALLTNNEPIESPKYHYKG